MAIKERLGKYNPDEILFFMAVIFKPLYLLPSGSFQIGDFLLLAAAAIHLLKSADSEDLLPIHKEELSLLVFVIGVLMINFTYFVLIGTKDFLVNTVYYIFNFIIVLFAADILQTERKSNFLYGLCNSCKVVILFQALVYVTGRGELQSDGRYVGTFNDPNQYAVFILFCLFIMLDIYHEINPRAFAWLAAGTALIIPSGSTGIMIGLAVFAALFLIVYFIDINRKKMLIGTAGIIAFAAFLVFMSKHGNLGSIDVVGMMRSRIEVKLSNITSISDMFNFFINDRVWNRVFEQPKYLLYGAGEGAHSRFDAGGIIAHEIHSSVLGPPFYYGIGIAFFMFRWILKKLKHIDAFQFCIYTALIAESVFLVNYRQPLFWILFILAGRDKNNELTVSGVNETENLNLIIV